MRNYYLEWKYKGSALIETLIIFPVFLILALGALQWSLIYEAKSTLNYATFMAARAGAVDHASSSSIRKALARGLVPLYSPNKNIAGLYSKAVTTGATMLPFTRIRILNPTTEAFADFGVFPPNSNIKEIPNDHLNVRSVNVGSQSGLNIQDANILKIEVQYAYQLKVPFVNKVITTIVSWFTTDPTKLAYLRLGRLPILSSSIVRMQSAARQNSLMVSQRDIDNRLNSAQQPSSQFPLTLNQRPWQSGPTGGNKVDYNHPNLPPIANNGGSTGGSTGGSSGGSTGGSTGSTGGGTGGGNPSSCAASGPASNTTTVASASTGNPINVTNGNKYEREEDLSPLPGKLGLEFVRHYNSQSTYQGVIGYGWSHSYDLQFNVVDDHHITLRQADGRVLYFEKQKSGDYIAQQAADGILKKVAEGYDWKWFNGRKLQFTEQGKLQRIISSTGNETQLYYTADGKLIKIIDSQDRRISLAYNSKGYLVEMTDPGNEKYHYVYDQKGNLEKVIYPDKTARAYHYEDQYDPHNLTGLTDQRGIRFATWQYDEHDRAILSTHANGVQKVTLKFEKGKTLVTNSRGVTSTYTIGMINHVPVVERVDGPGCSTCGLADVSYTYNNNVQISSMHYKNGEQVRYGYDDRNRVINISKLSSAGKVRNIEKFEYKNGYYPVAIIKPSINPQGAHRVDISYNDKGMPISITESGWKPNLDKTFTRISRRINFKYKANKLAEIDGPITDIDDRQYITWNDRNLIKEIRYPNGKTENYLEYDNNGLVTKIKTIDGLVLSLKYDSRNNLISVSHANKQIIKQRYNPAGLLVEKTIGSKSIFFAYDNAQRKISEIAGNYRKEYQWRSDNNPDKLRWYVGKRLISEVGYVYGKYNRLVAKTNLNGEKVKIYQYSGLSRKVSYTEEGDKSYSYQYDDIGRLISIATQDKKIYFSAHMAALPEKIIDARGNQTLYGRDDFGQTVYTQSPDSGITEYGYNPAGILVYKSDANKQVVALKYDLNNILSGIKFNDDKVTVQNVRNHIFVIRDKKNEEIRKYDVANREKIIQIARNGKYYKNIYKYDELGRLIRKRLPDGRYLKYSYSKNAGNKKDNVLIEIEGTIFNTTLAKKQVVNDVSKNSHTVTYEFGNQVKETYRKINNRLDSIAIGNGSIYHYLYNKKSKILGINQGNKIYTRYKYDNSGRLVFALTPNALYGYRYDKNGNRIRKVVNGEHHAYRYDKKSNRLLSVKSRNIKVSLGYRNDGSLSSIQGYHFVYNSNGQPVIIYQDDINKPLVRYEYNSRGERTSKAVYLNNGSVNYTGYLYENNKIIAELDQRGIVRRQYVYLDNKPIAIIENNSIYYIISNHLGAPIAVSDSAGRAIWSATYSPFGQSYVNPDADGDGNLFELNIRFPGQYEDKETGYYYNYYRYYDPAAGRYISSDPLGQRAGTNTYAYVNNNPIHYYDPLGLLLFAFDGTMNTDVQAGLNSSNAQISNVVKFREAYNGDTGGVSVVRNTRGGNALSGKAINFYYVNGIGRDDAASGIQAPLLDAALGSTLLARVNYMADLLLQHIDQMRQQNIYDTTLTIDVVGFSRGAAEARVFSNLVQDFINVAKQPQQTQSQYQSLATSYYTNNPVQGLSGSAYNQALNRYANVFTYLTTPCNRVNLDLNYIGLWDTVPHYGFSQSNDITDLRLGIPSSANYVNQAVAANEHRSQFDLVSIHSSRTAKNSATRVEKSFIGAHSDIGGGYGEGDLSNVAFMWMIEQSNNANVFVDYNVIAQNNWDIVTNPVVHDSVGVSVFTGPDRTVRYLDGSSDTQMTYSGGNLSTAQARTYFDQRYMQWITVPRPNGKGSTRKFVNGVDAAGDRTLVGLVNVTGTNTYQQWLQQNYGLNIKINHANIAGP